ncbi:short transient receptor potential channel 4-associated protein-like [Lytechinus pictus]|uniref:short transient receptor potential channel 4-associated protein-like n=1 Tax=Lytechinus pictus TaxID=7653 RepID=UPI0030B9AFE0
MERKTELSIDLDGLRVTRSRRAAAAAAAANANGNGTESMTISMNSFTSTTQTTSTATAASVCNTSTSKTTSSRISTNSNTGNDSTIPRKRVKRNPLLKNVFLGVRDSQHGKRPFKSATELPRELLMSCESRIGLVQPSSNTQSPSAANPTIPIIAAELSEAAKSLLNTNPELQQYYLCLKLLKKVTQKLMSESTIEYPTDSGKFKESKTINAEIFLLFGGVEVTVDLLLQPHFYKKKQKKKLATSSESKESKADEEKPSTSDTPETSTTTTPEAATSTETTPPAATDDAASTATEAAAAASTTETEAEATEMDDPPPASSTATPSTATSSSAAASSTVTTSASSTQQASGSFQFRLVRDSYSAGSSGHPASQDPQKVLRHKIAYNAMDLLHYMCQNMGTDMATPLSDHDDLIVYLFTLLTEKQCFLKAATLIEDILGVRTQMFKLQDIPELEELVKKFEEDQLANFCRVLSITISELDPKDDPCTLAAQDKACRNRSDTPISEVNQKTVVELPGFVQKLVKIACKSVAEPDGVADMDTLFSQIDSWVTWLDSSLAFDALAEVANEDEGVYLNLPLHDLSLPLPDSLKTMHEVVYKVEVLHVLCLLLGGKQRHKVHEILAQYKLMPGLNNLFDKVIWRCNLRAPIHGVNENCDCSPEVALKVQFLRLLHTYCDHHDNKYLIMTRHEINDLNRISTSSNIPQLEAVKKIDRTLLCQGQKGILTKLVEVMKKEPRDSPFRFWMARAIESFLRGKTSYADQTFLIRKGLLEHVVQHILSSEHHSKEVLQSYFDLLAELMKFNILAFKRFNKAIHSEHQFKQFVHLVRNHIVDSNMFVRCLALTIEHFEKEQPENYDWGIQSCRLLQFISKRENRLTFLYKLINIIHVEILTQENVSCLNTTIIFLMFADRIGELSRYLTDLRKEEQKQCRPGFLLQNFRELLFFWQEHYLHKDKDCSALEKSSCISFSKWKDMVSLLVSGNTHSSLTVAHYLQMDDLFPCTEHQHAPLRTS